MKERAPELTREGERYPSRDAGPRLPAGRPAGARAGTAHRRRPVVASHASADGAQPHKSMAARGRRLVHRGRHRAGGGGMPRRVGVARAGAARAPSAESRVRHARSSRSHGTRELDRRAARRGCLDVAVGARVVLDIPADGAGRGGPATAGVPARPRSSIPGRERAATRPPHAGSAGSRRSRMRPSTARPACPAACRGR